MKYAVSETNHAVQAKCREDLGHDSTTLTAIIQIELDMQDRQAVIWEPYTADTIQTLPPVYREGFQIWPAKTSLICFKIVKMHVLDRVLHQLRFTQHNPNALEQVARIEHTSKPM